MNGSFWRRIDPEASSDGVDFPLVRRARATGFTFLHASDTHLEDKSIDRMRLLRQLVVDLRPDFVIITGDLVANAPGVGEDRARHDFELFLHETGGFPVPVRTVPGNRDTFGVERHNSLVSSEHPLFDKKMFRHYLGPNYYSFDWCGVHFIALDSVGA